METININGKCVCTFTGNLTSINRENETGTVESDIGVLSDVPFHYHCQDSESISGGQSAFLVNDQVKVVSVKTSNESISPENSYIIGFLEERKLCNNVPYVFLGAYERFLTTTCPSGRILYDSYFDICYTDYISTDYKSTTLPPGSFVEQPTTRGSSYRAPVYDPEIGEIFCSGWKYMQNPSRHIILPIGVYNTSDSYALTMLTTQLPFYSTPGMIQLIIVSTSCRVDFFYEGVLQDSFSGPGAFVQDNSNIYFPRNTPWGETQPIGWGNAQANPAFSAGSQWIVTSLSIQSR